MRITNGPTEGRQNSALGEKASLELEMGLGEAALGAAVRSS